MASYDFNSLSIPFKVFYIFQYLATIVTCIGLVGKCLDILHFHAKTFQRHHILILRQSNDFLRLTRANLWSSCHDCLSPWHISTRFGILYYVYITTQRFINFISYRLLQSYICDLKKINSSLNIYNVNDNFQLNTPLPPPQKKQSF